MPLKKRCRQCFQKKIMNLKSRDITDRFRLKVYSLVSFRGFHREKQKSQGQLKKMWCYHYYEWDQCWEIISSFCPCSEWWGLDFTQESKGKQNKNIACLGGKKEVMDQMIQYKCHLTWDKNMIRQIVKIIFVNSYSSLSNILTKTHTYTNRESGDGKDSIFFLLVAFWDIYPKLENIIIVKANNKN